MAHGLAGRQVDPVSMKHIACKLSSMPNLSQSSTNSRMPLQFDGFIPGISACLLSCISPFLYCVSFIVGWRLTRQIMRTL